MVRLIVVLVVMRLDAVAVTELGQLPSAEVNAFSDIYGCLDNLIRDVGMVPNLGSLKLVDLITADDGTVFVAYRIRTRGHALENNWQWAPVGQSLRTPEYRQLVDKAWEGERP